MEDFVFDFENVEGSDKCDESEQVKEITTPVESLEKSCDPESTHTTSSVPDAETVSPEPISESDSISTPLSVGESNSESTSVIDPAKDEPVVEASKRVEIDGREIEVAVNEAILSSMADSLMEARNKAKGLKDSISEQDAQIKAFDAEMRRIKEEMQAKINALAQDRNKIEMSLFETRREIRRAEQEVYSEERKFKQALENEQAKKDFQQRAIQFDDLTVGYQWREFALPHQIEGAKRLALVKRGILGDKMGLGKTLTSLIYCDMLQAKRILIVVPADVLRNFEREIAHWAPHRNVATLGKISKAERAFAIKMFNQMDEFIVTINYEAWRKDKSLLADIQELRFDTVIMDEAHTIKNTGTAAFKGMRDIIMAENCCPKCGGPVGQVQEDRYTYYYECAVGDWTSKDRDSSWEVADRRSVKNVLPMTGTPILNKPQDLFPLLHMIQPEVYTSEKNFLWDYCDQDYYTGKWKFRTGGMESLTKKLGSRFVARDRHSAGVILPPQEIQIHDIEFETDLYPQQWKIIQQLSKHGQILLDSGKAMTVLAMIALITRQRQANVWPGGIQLKDADGNVVFAVSEEVTESLKMDKAQEMIQELVEGGERVVLFSQFKTPLRELGRRLQSLGIRAAVFDGDTPESERERIKIDFDRKYCEVPGYESHYDVVLCNYKTGGVGLNFTSATQMIILDEEWNPGKRDQGYGRIDRIGQTQETTVHVLRIQKTIDTWMASLISEKEEMIQGFESNMDLQQRLSDMFREGTTEQ